MDIGQRIRELRVSRDLTLEELADRCELTKGFLSQLENNVNTPSIQTLEDITEVLGISMSDFFKEDSIPKVIFNNADYFVDEKGTFTRTWLVPNAKKNEMEPILLKLAPGGSSMVIQSHTGEEFGFVLKGSPTLVFADKQTWRLKKRNTFYLTGRKEHWIENRSESEVELIWVCTPPIF